MLDIRFIREHPEKVRENQKKRGLDPKEVDLILELDEKWRKLKQESDDLRSERNKISEKINEAKKEGKKVEEVINKARAIPEKIKKLEEEMLGVDEKRKGILEKLPNMLDKSVPIGDASKNKVIEKVGKAKKKSFKLKGHEEILTALDQLDIERAAKVSGARFYYLKGDLVRLNLGIIRFAIDFLNKKGFTPIHPPYMIKKSSLQGAIPLSTFEEMIYKAEGEDLYLIGTAEHAINAYHSNEIINVEKPIRFAGISTCFRKEAGSHGKDTKGIFRIHQFEKVEQFVFCKPEDAPKEYDMLLNNTKELFKQLGIPFRTVILSSQDTGMVPTKTIDVEGYYPSQDQYRELGSCSNCLDYQARRSNIKYEEKGERKYVYTLNNTAIATERMITCIVDNYQKADGSIEIPKVLHKYTGFKVIKPKTAKKK